MVLHGTKCYNMDTWHYNDTWHYMEKQLPEDMSICLLSDDDDKLEEINIDGVSVKRISEIQTVEPVVPLHPDGNLEYLLIENNNCNECEYIPKSENDLEKHRNEQHMHPTNLDEPSLSKKTLLQLKSLYHSSNVMNACL